MFRVFKKEMLGFGEAFVLWLDSFRIILFIYIDINRVERSVVPQQKSVFFERGVCRSFVRSFER